MVGGVNRRGWRARQGARGENRTGFAAGPHDVAVARGAIADFGGRLGKFGPNCPGDDLAGTKTGPSALRINRRPTPRGWDRQTR